MKGNNWFYKKGTALATTALHESKQFALCTQWTDYIHPYKMDILTTGGLLRKMIGHMMIK
jgi:hypothetical protein